MNAGGALVLAMCVALGALASDGQAATPEAGAREARAMLDRYCVACHNARARVAGLTLDTLNVETIGSSAEAWEKVARKLRSRLMPPAGSARPSAEDYA